MTILIYIIISSLAVGFLVESVGALLENYVSIPIYIKGVVSVPLAVLSCWILGIEGWVLVIGGLASAFIYVAVMRWLDRPVQIQQVMSRRMQ
jgi:hypothetical protein